MVCAVLCSTACTGYWGHWRRSALSTQQSEHSHRGFFLDGSKMEYTWKGHLMHPNHSPWETVPKEKSRNKHTNKPPNACCVGLSQVLATNCSPTELFGCSVCSCRHSCSFCRLQLGQSDSKSVSLKRLNPIQYLNLHWWCLDSRWKKQRWWHFFRQY